MLRPASIEEISLLAEVRGGFGEAEIRARFEWLAKVNVSVNVSWYVWWLSDQPRGWALIQWAGKPTVPHFPDLNDLYVHPDWRSQGIGTQILAACEQMVRAAGHKIIGLSVNPDLNPRAYLLYQRLGYSPRSQEKYLDGVYNGVEDWVIDLEKRL